MNTTIQLQHSHRSDRSFTDAPLSEEHLSAIIEAAYRAPTSINSQEVSLVVIRDAARRARIAEIAGGQPWIAKAPVFITVLVDFHKTQQGLAKAGFQQVIHESVEGFGVGALDAGIALGNLMVAARALGLGAVPIGGIRRDPQAMIDLLHLPPLTYPIVGIAIGHVDKPATQKPRMPISAFCHEEYYRPEAILPAIAAYDEELPQYWRSIGRNDGLPWSTNIAERYARVYYPQTRPVSLKQGFLNDK